MSLTAESEIEAPENNAPEQLQEAATDLALESSSVAVAGDQPRDPVAQAATEKVDYWNGDARVSVDGALHIHSKRTERLKKKLQKRQKKPLVGARGILDLPYELILDILALLRPSDLFRLSRVNRSLHEFVLREEALLANNIVKWRFHCLERCLRLPVPLEEVHPSMGAVLQIDERQEIMTLNKKPYQHVQSPDPAFLCTCMSCLFRWNCLCLAIDFAYWQDNLDKGEPIPIIPRGRSPVWNQELITAHANIVRKALFSPLWHAAILEAHLNSTTNSIRRHSQNKGNKRRRYAMTKEDEASETDAFLERSGPPTFDFPYHRDNYYMLEAYLPNRSWIGEQNRWVYMPAEQHQTDLGHARRWATWKFGKDLPIPKHLIAGLENVQI